VQSWFTYARLGDERRLATARRRIEEADGISEHAFVRSVADR